ncbi:MAG: hypothetical protein ACC628_09535 [Pirellulaceae bacterium]
MRTLSLLVACVVGFQVHTAEAQSPNTVDPILLQPVPIASSPYGSGNPRGIPNTGQATACLPYAAAGGVTYGYPANTTYRPLWPVLSMPSSYYVGRGVLGQPKVYVPGQPIRNVLRYLTP